MNQEEKVFFLKYLLIWLLILAAISIIADIILSLLLKPKILKDESKKILKQLDKNDSKKANKIFNKFNSEVANQLIKFLSTKENIKKFLDAIDENADDKFFKDLNSTIFVLFDTNASKNPKINIENQKAFLLNLSQNNIKSFSKLNLRIERINEIFGTKENIEDFLKSIDSKDKETFLIKLLLESRVLLDSIKGILNFGQSDTNNKNFENLKVFLQKINSNNVDLMINLINFKLSTVLDDYGFDEKNIFNKNSQDILAEILDVINEDNSKFLTIEEKVFFRSRFNFPNLISFLKLINQDNKDVFFGFFEKGFSKFLYRSQNYEQRIIEKISHHLEKMAQNIKTNKDAFQNAMNALKGFCDDKNNNIKCDFGKLLIFVLTSDDIEKHKDLNQEKIKEIIGSEEYKNYKLEPVYYSIEPVTTSLSDHVYEVGTPDDISVDKQ